MPVFVPIRWGTFIAAIAVSLEFLPQKAVVCNSLGDAVTVQAVPPTGALLRWSVLELELHAHPDALCGVRRDCQWCVLPLLYRRERRTPEQVAHAAVLDARMGDVTGCRYGKAYVDPSFNAAQPVLDRKSVV